MGHFEEFSHFHSIFIFFATRDLGNNVMNINMRQGYFTESYDKSCHLDSTINFHICFFAKIFIWKKFDAGRGNTF